MPSRLMFAGKEKPEVTAGQPRAGTGRGQFNVWDGSSLPVSRDFIKECVWSRLWVSSTMSSREHNATFLSTGEGTEETMGNSDYLGEGI